MMMPGSLRGMIIFVIVLFFVYIILKIRTDHIRRKRKDESRFRFRK